MTEDKVKAQIVDIVKKEYQMHMVNLFEGNVSARMEDRVWVTPSQVSKEEMTEDMLIEMDLSGHILKCPAGFRPSSETGMHLEVYRLCPDVQAVLHNHSTYATAYAVNHMPIPAGFLTEVDMFFGEIPVTPYGKPGTAEVYKDFYQSRKKSTPSGEPWSADNGGNCAACFFLCGSCGEGGKDIVYCGKIGNSTTD